MPIQFNPGGADAMGNPGPTWFDPETGDAIDMSEVVPGYAGAVTGNVAVAPQQPAKAQASTPTAKDPLQGTFNVVRAAKARLRAVKKEIKRLRELEKEQSQLERILAAADKPLAVVRDISTKRTSK